MGDAKRIPLKLGAYQARSIIANAQRSVNLYMENNPEDSPFPSTHYPTPGLRLLSTATNGQPWRQLFLASNQQLYGVAGNTVYKINIDWTMTSLGTIDSSSGFVSMVDNSIDLMIVDGSPNGWTVKLGTGMLQKITDSSFAGADRVDFVDGYFILNSTTNTKQWYISLFEQSTFDPLDFASKLGYSDPIVATCVTKRNVWLFGTQTTEVWANTGDTAFTFGRIDGVFIQHGCASASSISQMDGSIYWLALDPQGHAMVLRNIGYDSRRISTHAMEVEFQSYARIDDAIGFTYQQDGHLFYVLTFPTADRTWVYDLSTEQWHERVWIDSDGNFHRHRANCFAFFNNTHVVGDWENGNLYALDLTVYTDVGNPIPRIRSFPHLMDSGDRMMYREFIAAMEVGNGDGSNDPVPVFLRWSDTAGRSWGNAISETIGKEGDYIRSVQFQRLGMARDRIFELSWSSPVKTALNGAFLEYYKANQ